MIRYTSSLEGITPDKLQGFFVGWAHPPSASMHLQILHHSSEVVLALDDHTGQVVGFITAITDSIFAAYIPLLEVLPAYQQQGVGSALVRQMLEKLARFYMVDLTCDEALQGFYAALGLHPAQGMMLRRPEQLSGRA